MNTRINTLLLFVIPMSKLIYYICVLFFLIGCSNEKDNIEINGQNYVVKSIIQKNNIVTILTVDGPSIALYIPNDIVRIHCASSIFYYWDLAPINYTILEENEIKYGDIKGKMIEERSNNKSILKLELFTEKSSINGKLTIGLNNFGRRENYISILGENYKIERVIERDSGVLFTFDTDRAVRIELEKKLITDLYIKTTDIAKMYVCKNGNDLSIDFRFEERGIKGNYTGEIEIEE